MWYFHVKSRVNFSDLHKYVYDLNFPDEVKESSYSENPSSYLLEVKGEDIFTLRF